MIPSTHLRIGNLVRYHHDGGFIDAPIFHLTDEDVNVLPIELTPEILEKAGFRKERVLGSKTKYWYGLGELSYSEAHDGWWFRGVFRDIKYLHDLQNTYFALTGEELEINL